MSRTSVRSIGAALAAVLTLASWPAPGLAQEPAPWRFSVMADAGGLYSLRDLGKKVITIPNGSTPQFRTELRPSVLIGVGLEATTPMPYLKIRARARTTVGGKAEGEIFGCAGIPDPQSGGLCVVEESGATARLFTVGILAGRHVLERSVYPFLAVEVGAVSYDFEERTCDQTRCDAQEEILVDQTVPLLEVGIGLRAGLGPFDAIGQVSAVLSDYGGGEGNDKQNTVFLSLGAVLPLG